MDKLELLAEITQALVLLFSAIFAYFKFFKEGTHKPRIEFDIGCKFLGNRNNGRIAAFRVITHNHGLVNFDFSDIRIEILGILKGEQQFKIKQVRTMRNTSPYLDFSENLNPKNESFSIIPKKYKYFFVRPGVTQEFSYNTIIPTDWEFVKAKATFRYPTTGELHTTERMFRVENKETNTRKDD